MAACPRLLHCWCVLWRRTLRWTGFHSATDVVSEVHAHGDDAHVCRCVVVVLGAERERKRRWPPPRPYSLGAEELDDDGTRVGAAVDLHGDENTSSPDAGDEAASSLVMTLAPRKTSTSGDEGAAAAWPPSSLDPLGWPWIRLRRERHGRPALLGLGWPAWPP